MKQMAAGVFKAKCLKVMDEVHAKRVPVVITKRGKPLVKMVPIDDTHGQDEIFGCLKGKVKTKGDIVKPVLTLKEWGSLA